MLSHARAYIPAAGELFDFEAEVEPILEVLVGRVLEQGLMEVREEEELAAMREHQAQMAAVRDAGGQLPGLLLRPAVKSRSVSC